MGNPPVRLRTNLYYVADQEGKDLVLPNLVDIVLDLCLHCLLLVHEPHLLRAHDLDIVVQEPRPRFDFVYGGVEDVIWKLRRRRPGGGLRLLSARGCFCCRHCGEVGLCVVVVDRKRERREAVGEPGVAVDIEAYNEWGPRQRHPVAGQGCCSTRHSTVTRVAALCIFGTGGGQAFLPRRDSRRCRSASSRGTINQIISPATSDGQDLLTPTTASSTSHGHSFSAPFSSSAIARRLCDLT